MTPQQQAQQWLRDNCLILDTETTGLGDDAEIVEIAIIDTTGKPLINTLVKPSKPIPEATAIHGITNEMVMDAPQWKDIFPSVDALISGRTVVIYNSQYDVRLLYQTNSIWDVTPGFKNGFTDFQCAMLEYAAFYGQRSDRGGYKWQRLTAAADQQGVKIEGTAHRALSDCLTTLGVIKAMAIGGKATSTLSAQSAVDTLQQLFKADPTAITALVNNRVFCSEGFVRDTPATVGICDGVYLVGMIGIINALIAPEVIAAIYDDMELTGFTVANITTEGSTS
ncbi:MAG: 3'-5' exonuclease [Serratia grimesii]|uniref:3'-5' exonuclease n=1 Tax=Serratia grimesii TaxID=82995 RepID=UPI003F94E5BC